MNLAVFLPQCSSENAMFCHLKPCEFGAKDTQTHSNAFLSSSVCVGCPLLVSTSFLKTVGYKIEQDITPTTQAPPS